MPNPSLDQAAKNCKAYRKYLKSKNIPDHLATKGFLVTRDMIDHLFAQSPEIAGIRIYVGLDETVPNMQIRPYAVACVKNGEKYNDWKVPAAQQPLDTSMAAATTVSEASNTTLTTTPIAAEITTDLVVVEEPRPCPSECSDPNQLNTGV